MAIIKLVNVYNSFVDESRPSLRKMLKMSVKRKTILKDISFEVNPGELLGVIGNNGVGKSTLLRLISGIYEKDSGTIITDGEIVSIFELGSFFSEELTGERYCRDYLSFNGVKKTESDELISSIKDFTELGEFFYKKIKTYSSGMKAKLLYATATALPAEIVLIDEFLIVGDEYFQAKAWKRLREFLSKGTLGIIVSHDWTSLLKLCRRSAILTKDGISIIGNTYKVIPAYLKIPNHISDVVHFNDREKLIYGVLTAECGEGLSFSCRVDINDKKVEWLGVGFSIERLIEGVGWNLAYTGQKNIDIKNRKQVDITLQINEMNLAPGEYVLCLFLSSYIKGYNNPVDVVYDSLTWLTGDPIRLTIPGENIHKQLIRKRLKWKINQL